MLVGFNTEGAEAAATHEGIDREPEAWGITIRRDSWAGAPPVPGAGNRPLSRRAFRNTWPWRPGNADRRSLAGGKPIGVEAIGRDRFPSPPCRTFSGSFALASCQRRPDCCPSAPPGFQKVKVAGPRRRRRSLRSARRILNGSPIRFRHIIVSNSILCGDQPLWR
jgi:hypothetical protein